MAAEQLSQAQIDALLGKLTEEKESGEPVEIEEKSPEVKKYDFRSPKKFTKEQLKALNGLHENYSRMLSSFFSGVLRLFCEISVVSIEEQRYFEYNNALPDNALVGLMNFKPENKRLTEGMWLMDMSTSLGYFIIERLLGAQGDGNGYVPDRDYTDIEIAILENTFRKIVLRLQEAWAGYVDVNFSLSGIETNARLLQAFAPEDIVVLIMMDIKIKNVSGTLNICIPAENLEEVIGNLSIKYTRNSKRHSLEDEATRKQIIFGELMDSDLEIKAILDQSQLMLKDILQLQVSDVIPLNKKISNDIMITVDGLPWYNAKLGEVKLKKAVKLTEVVDRSKERS
ncbi:MAG: flagellar motor switch protein FliM [Oscillospiraceae bacterium]|nr:flagellar motor switch protein FliM [Oscillospiraceae bacterium]